MNTETITATKRALARRGHAMECLRDGNAANCPICKPINDSLTKCISYAYPTSDRAKELGFYLTGCWVVSAYAGLKHAMNYAGYPTKAEAVEHANKINLPWNKYSAH